MSLLLEQNELNLSLNHMSRASRKIERQNQQKTKDAVFPQQNNRIFMEVPFMELPTKYIDICSSALFPRSQGFHVTKLETSYFRNPESQELYQTCPPK